MILKSVGLSLTIFVSSILSICYFTKERYCDILNEYITHTGSHNIYVVRYNIPSTVNNTPINIIEKIYTYSLQGFSKYIKLNLLQSYKYNCTIYDSYTCSRS